MLWISRPLFVASKGLKSHLCNNPQPMAYNLYNALKANEFYTPGSPTSSENSATTRAHFRDKVMLCHCDDPLACLNPLPRKKIAPRSNF